jgi:hypothetical protein
VVAAKIVLLYLYVASAARRGHFIVHAYVEASSVYGQHYDFGIGKQAIIDLAMKQDASLPCYIVIRGTWGITIAIDEDMPQSMLSDNIMHSEIRQLGDPI